MAKVRIRTPLPGGKPKVANMPGATQTNMPKIVGGVVMQTPPSVPGMKPAPAMGPGGFPKPPGRVNPMGGSGVDRSPDPHPETSLPPVRPPGSRAGRMR